MKGTMAIHSSFIQEQKEPMKQPKKTKDDALIPEDLMDELIDEIQTKYRKDWKDKGKGNKK